MSFSVTSARKVSNGAKVSRQPKVATPLANPKWREGNYSLEKVLRKPGFSNAFLAIVLRQCD
jgi:hypothetical protein